MSTAALSPRTVSLEVTSDTICPFCYVGYKRLASAIKTVEAKHPHITFSLSFAPFQLDGTLGQALNKRKRYQDKYGGVERVAEMEKAMIERGKAEGINFSYGGLLSNTVDSHRIVEKALELKGSEGQVRLVTEQLFPAYFEHEKDIGSHDVLAEAAEAAGIMSKQEALTFLASNELLDKVNAGFVLAQQRGISGVPFTIIDQKLAVSGAQETATFVEVLEKVAKGEIVA